MNMVTRCHPPPPPLPPPPPPLQRLFNRPGEKKWYKLKNQNVYHIGGGEGGGGGGGGSVRKTVLPIRFAGLENAI